MIRSRGGASRKRLEASPLQQAMLAASRTGPTPRPYVQQFRWTLHASVDPARFRQAVLTALRGHDVFRHRFVRSPSGRLLVEIADRPRASFRFRDWSRHPDSRAKTDRFLEQDRNRGFPSESGLLCRFNLIRIGARVHEFIWTSHHALLDGRSRWVVLRDILSQLEGTLAKARTTKPDASAFTRHLRWLREQPAAPAKAYWKARMAGFSEPTPLDFALRFAPDAPPPGPAGRIELPFGPAAEHSLRRSLRDGAHSLNAYGQAAWGLFLSRTSGRSTVCFGAPRAARTSGVLGAGEAAGLFMNTLPVILAIDPAARVRDLLSQARRQWRALRAVEHAQAALAREAAPLGPDVPLFESVFGCEHGRIEDRMRAAGRLGRRDRIELLAHTDIPLVMQLIDGNRVRVESVFDASRFSGVGIAHVLRSFEWIVRQMAENPDAALGDITLLGGRARARVMRTGRGPALRGAPASVHALFGRHAQRSPDRTALRDGGRTLTYRELDRQTDRMAGAMIDRGVRPGDRVGLHLGRSIEFVAGALAALKAGAVYVPLEVDYPRERIRWMIGNAKPRMTLCTAEGPGGIRRRGSDFVTIGSLLADGFPGRVRRIAAAPDDVACILYTSGSTGTPKGVEVTHRGIDRLVRGDGCPGLGPSTRTLFHSAVSFDASTFEIWAALLNGGACVVCRDSPLDFGQTRDLIVRGRVNTLWLTASLFNLIVDEEPGMLDGIRHVLTGGEPLSPPHVRRFYSRNRGSTLINGYGPTENTTFSCCHRIPRSHPGSAPVPIGRPIAGSFAFVADAGGRVVPPGVPGELLAGGAGVALGYWEAPLQTRRSFIRDPDSSDPKARLYRTGDRAVLRYDGLFEFLGRTDSQVKIRGFRVEPEEVRRAILRLEGIKAAAVVPLDEPDGGPVLHAFVVPGRPEVRDPAAIAAALRETLPAFLVPGHVHVVPALPATVHGKIDREALRLRMAEAQERPIPASARPGGIEERLLRIWREDLGLSPNHVRESFFSVGGNSLSAARLLHRVNEVFATSISLDRLRDADTVESMARMVGSALGGSGSPDGRPRADPGSAGFVLKRRPRRGRRPISRQWQRHQFEARLGSGRSTTTICRAFGISGALDADRLEGALARLVRAHEALRTYVEERDGSSWERIWAPSGPVMQRIDLSALRADEAWEAARFIFAGESVRVVSLNRPPLFAFKLIRLPVGGHMLILNFHHAIVDGSSLGILFGQLAELYDDPSRTRPAHRVSGFTCRDLADSVDSWLRRGALRSLERHWAPALRNLPVVRLPFERDVPLPVPQKARIETFAFPRELCARIDAAGAGLGVSRYAFFLATLRILIFRHTGCRDFPILSAVPVRMVPGAENIVGDTTNNVLLRTAVEHGETFRTLARRVAATLMTALAHRAYPMMELRKACPARTDFGRDPLRQMTFHSALDAADSLKLGEAEATPIPREQSLAYIRLHFILGRSAGGIALTAIYPETSAERHGLRRFVDEYRASLSSFADDPSRAAR